MEAEAACEDGKAPRRASAAGDEAKTAQALFLARSVRLRFDDLAEQALQEAPVDPLTIQRVEGLYIVLISLHGLVRGNRMELGRDPDTGGQVLKI